MNEAWDECMRKVWLLMVGFGAAGCLMTLLLASNGILLQKDEVPVPEFSLLQEIPEPVAGREVVSEKIALPYHIPGTSLRAVRLSTYEGPFLEDGSNRNVFHTAALEIENIGEKMVRNASVILVCANTRLVFEISFLPPGSTVLALEVHGKASSAQRFSSVSGEQTLLEAPDFGLKYLKIADVAMGVTHITNQSPRKIGPLTLYYKAALGTTPLYIGGITYAYRIAPLQPGETVILNLPNYAMDHSRIVAAEE